MALRATFTKSLLLRNNLRVSAVASRMFSADEPGKGSGKGGGSGGAIRDAGGAFGKREAAAEDHYFRKLQQEQLSKMKDHIKDEIEHHEEELKHHQEAIERHKKALNKLAKEEK